MAKLCPDPKELMRRAYEQTGARINRITGRTATMRANRTRLDLIESRLERIEPMTIVFEMSTKMGDSAAWCWKVR
jgi:hypothetical protein